MDTKVKFFYVKKRTLLAIAGCVWILAGFNVARLGVVAYALLSPVKWSHILLSVVVFVPFATMFFKMVKKHVRRIFGYAEEKRPFWNFFDLKSYIIMIFMMSMGIALRAFAVVSSAFVAVFYTGLGCALTLAGVCFWVKFFKKKPLD